MRDDAYSVLGVSRHASDADVRSAYRRQALTTHPDKGGTAEAFRRVVQAFETLGDVRRRAAYERAVFGPEKRDSPSRRTAWTSGPRVPTEAAQGGRTKRRRHEARAEPQEKKKKHRKNAACPNQCSTAAQEKDESELPRPACSKRRPPTQTAAGSPKKCQTGKPSSVTRIIEELVKMVASALTKRLNELSDATLAEIEAFLRDNIGGDHEQTEWERNEAATEENDVGRGGGDDGIMDDESCPSEEAAATLALMWGGEEDVMSGASGSDSELIPCDADFNSGPHLPADGVQVADATATARPVVAENSDAATMDICNEGAATLAAVGNGVAKHGDVVDDGTTEVSTPLPPRQSAQGQSMFRGVSKSHGKFMAQVGVEGILFRSSDSDLATAIDIHIFLVRLRQIVITRVQEGIDFPDALREVDGLVMAERQCKPFDWRLSYSIRRRVRVGDTWRNESKQTRNIDEAIALWEKMYGSHFQARTVKRRHVFAKRQEWLERLKRLARVRSENNEKKQAEKNERKRRRFQKRQMVSQQRIERKRQAQARKRQAQERKRQRQERVEARLLRRKRFVLAHTQRILRSRRRRQERILLGRWGVRKFPMGVEAASLHQANDSVCCVLRLSDGSMRQGPPRLSLKEAETDAIELSALRSRRGDVAACIELERRDVAAMTAHFLQVI
eukprot:TRINITY_DN6890_c0_g1_i5.p1 TRINITY_DN6890_c0_g1~~TRINITY_DN6890_c0_g1_i5.p1  ORF type:complete len:675 (-),score=126.01 TRINITY_DN6890_c0_g1_i5:169-2193(-)